MKMLNKKGFTLVETLIVTTFVMTLFLIVYQNTVPFLGEYKKMNSYDDIDSIYASNLFKQSILRYGNWDYIDQELSTKTYLDISNCEDTNIYKNVNYCKKIKESLMILDNDHIFITNYNISKFRDTVNKDDTFDSGKLNEFRDYLNTVSDEESFYIECRNNTKCTKEVIGKYRLFITRTVANTDNSKSQRYVNLGLYTGLYNKYNMGDVITFDPGDGLERTFYALKNSSSSESTVTLILAENLPNTTAFNSNGTNSIPDLTLSLLKNNTNTWINTITLTENNNYVSASGYTISYNGYQARLPEPSDFYDMLYCETDVDCFDTSSLFEIPIDTKNYVWLSDKLTDNNGYWLSSSVTNNNEMAWVVRNQNKQTLLSPVMINNSDYYGVRPVIIVSKDKLED